MPLNYLGRLDTRRSLLWSGFIWYAVLMARHATPTSGLWLNAAGIALVVGLILAANAIQPGGHWRQLGRWPLLRFFLIPFCVSSFSAAMRDAGLVAIFPRDLADNLIAGAAVAAFLLAVAVARWRRAST